MASVAPYRAYTSYGDSLVAFSALQAGGFHPLIANEIHTRSNHLHALALGGYRIYLPESELDDAAEWQGWLKTQALPDDDPTPQRFLQRRGNGLLYLNAIGALAIVTA